jgi:hypothetical protein
MSVMDPAAHLYIKTNRKACITENQLPGSLPDISAESTKNLSSRPSAKGVEAFVH